MSKGIIYLMTTVVTGLVKIGKTGSNSFEQRMHNLEHNGYRNVTGLKKEFAIEVEDYDEKELMLHTIFEKSRVSDTELFAIDKNIVIQLLSSFDGIVVYPQTESKEEIFDDATNSSKSKLIPNGIYCIKRNMKLDNQKVSAKANISNGSWTLLKNSILAIVEGVGGSQKAKNFRSTMPIGNNGILLEDVELGECSPSFAGEVVMNQSVNGWTDWKNSKGESVDIYRNKQ